MSAIKDWTLTAAEEIKREASDDWGATVGEIRAIVANHAPFKPDVAYMPVPRCDSCSRWRRALIDESRGRCTLQTDPSSKIWTVDGDPAIMTKCDFGCVQWKAEES